MGPRFFPRVFTGNNNEIAVFLQAYQLLPVDIAHQGIARLEGQIADTFAFMNRFAMSVYRKRGKTILFSHPDIAGRLSNELRIRRNNNLRNTGLGWRKHLAEYF